MTKSLVQDPTAELEVAKRNEKGCDVTEGHCHPIPKQERLSPLFQTIHQLFGGLEQWQAKQLQSQLYLAVKRSVPSQSLHSGSLITFNDDQNESTEIKGNGGKCRKKGASSIFWQIA